MNRTGGRTWSGQPGISCENTSRGERSDKRILSELSEANLQAWLNEYVNAGASKSLLSNLLLHIRAIWKHAPKKRLITENPTEDSPPKLHFTVTYKGHSVGEYFADIIVEDVLVLELKCVERLANEHMAHVSTI